MTAISCSGKPEERRRCAGQMDTRSQQNEAYSEANGMQGMEFDFACLSDSDDVRSYQGK